MQKGETIVGLYHSRYIPNNYYNNPYPFFSSFFPPKIGKKWRILHVLQFYSFTVLQQFQDKTESERGFFRCISRFLTFDF